MTIRKNFCGVILKITHFIPCDVNLLSLNEQTKLVKLVKVE